ncbi:MAG: alpha-1,4-glucan--maltose-1-phosphate maltosyltransferase [Burkholderiales bacterium]
MTEALRAEGRVRAVVEAVTPQVDCGRFPAKRIAGDVVVVDADCFADGHDAVLAELLWRREDKSEWHESAMAPLGNDRWRGTFRVAALGRYRYTVRAWVDHLTSWRRELARREDPEDIRVAARVGAKLVAEAAARARGDDAARLAHWSAALEAPNGDAGELRDLALDPALGALADRYPDRRFGFLHPELALVVDRERARFSAWYELFPRSTKPDGARHATFGDLQARLGYVAGMGFDVLYLPPIHPIGREKRKGKNNALSATARDPGSPWAIGAAEGGHTAVHPEFGTLEDFRRLVATARDHGLEVALDIAYQCAPDHPYVRSHPGWFRHRPDGTIQYAENPPKKYQDIYPFDFECDDWRGLWHELASVMLFWAAEGVRIFRVDNPHTKSLAFWEWAIGEVKRTYPDTIFLAEAFTRPKLMHYLAKLGFSQSYTYFAWRNSRQELIEYLTELAHGPGRDYLRPNLWPNTPDILTEYLQHGGRPAFAARLVLAATLGASYGIYGPAFELVERQPREPGSEEYLDSEKYEIRDWALDRPESLAPLIARVNRIRRDNPALHTNDTLRFLAVDNEQLVCAVKYAREPENIIVTVVNLDPHHPQSGWVDFDLGAIGIEAEPPFQMHELLTDARYLWHGRRNFVSLDPTRVPAHIFRVRRRVRTERDFDYYL